MARSDQFCTGHSIRQALSAILILVAFVVTWPSALAQSTLTSEAKAALQEGIASAKSQNWESAQKYFDDALIAAPGAPEILFNLGLLNDRKGGAELLASVWYRAYLAAVPIAPNRSKIEERLIKLHASAEARSAKFMATAKEAAKQLVPTVAISPTLGMSDNCLGGFQALLLGETIKGNIESVNEIIDWFQGNECQNSFLYSVVSSLFALERPQEASRYIEKISGPWKVYALTLFAAVKWKEGDRAGAIKLVEKAEVVATKLLKGSGKSALWDKYNAFRLRSLMAIAWCRVENVTKARRSLERIDPNTLAESIQSEGEIYGYPEFDSAVRAVFAALLSAGDDNKATAMTNSIISQIADDSIREYVQQSFKQTFDDLSGKTHEELIEVADYQSSVFYQLPLLDEHGWSESARSVNSGRETNTAEQDHWIEIARGRPGTMFGLFGDVYRDGDKFLASVSGSDPGYTVAILSSGAIDLFMGSQKIKEIAIAWREEGAGSAQ